MAIKPEIWHGCYRDRWESVIIEDAIGHPAKFSYGLITRIVDTGLERGWWKAGDLVGDPFGGVGLGGLIAQGRGLRWVGVELEERFCRMAAGYDCPGIDKREWVRWYGRRERSKASCPWCQGKADALYETDSGLIPVVDAHRYCGNFDKHKENGPRPVIIHGDSREFARLVGGCDSVLTSPPYSEGLGTHATTDPPTSHGRTGGTIHARSYGTSPGQIGALREGELKGVVTSPPFADSGAVVPVTGGNQQIVKNSRATGGEAGRHTNEYGSSPGQIGNLRPGSVEGVVTSPPFVDCLATEDEEFTRKRHSGENATRSTRENYGTSPGQIGALKSGHLSSVVTSPPWESVVPSSGGSETPANRRLIDAGTVGSTAFLDHEYGDSAGQIGVTSGETYWQACASVYAQCRMAIRPGGFMAVVVKDYVKAKKRVPLCDQTVTLMERVGFILHGRMRAMVVEETVHPGLFGEDVIERTQRKSFFRVLAEAKGAPPIDWEEVLVFKVPNAGDGGADLDAVVTSPPFVDSLANNPSDGVRAMHGSGMGRALLGVEGYGNSF